MPLPWVKLQVSLIDNDVFKRLSRSAKLTFYTCIPLAAKQDQDGALALRTGPMTVGEIAYYTGLNEKQQAEALAELVTAGFLTQRLDAAYVVERWKDKTGDTSTTRTRRYRERHGNAPGTSQDCSGDAVDKEEDKESRSLESLRSSALGFREWPTEVEPLQELAFLFVRAFANCHDPAKAANGPLSPYTALLGQMRGRGVSIAEAWQACADARKANGEKPLFSAQIKTAMSYLPARSPAPKKRGAYDGLRVVGQA